MAKLTASDFVIKADPFFLATRLPQCIAIQCVHNMRNSQTEKRSLACRLKTTTINEQGACDNFEAKETDD